MRTGKVRLDRLRRKQAERKVTGTNRTSRREFWHVHQIRRTYDRSQGKFSFNISYSTAVKLTPRTKVVAEAFGLGIDEELMFPVLDVELKIGPSDIVYVTGDSGSGKSVLLRAIKKDLADEAIDVVDIQVDREKPLIETVGRTVEEGLMVDWRALAGIHYRSHRVPAPRKIFVLKRGQELCGVIVYSYPAVTCFGRRLMLPKMGMKELNGKLSNISRVVVHPKYRTIGLGSKLIRDTLGLAGTEYAEMSAVMAKYNPFAEKAGMVRVAMPEPPKEALKVLHVLEKLG